MVTVQLGELLRSNRLGHEIVQSEMTQELQDQLKGLPGIQLIEITVKETSTDWNSASYSVELRLATGADLGIILERMLSLGWRHQGQDRNIKDLHTFIKTTSHPAADNWSV